MRGRTRSRDKTKGLGISPAPRRSPVTVYCSLVTGFPGGMAQWPMVDGQWLMEEAGGQGSLRAGPGFGRQGPKEKNRTMDRKTGLALSRGTSPGDLNSRQSFFQVDDLLIRKP